MVSTLIVFHSEGGCTAQLAEAVAAGAREVGEAMLWPILGQDIVAGRYRHPGLQAALRRADAVIFGCPTYMGGPSAQFKALADATSADWSDNQFADKLAAGFTCGGSLNGDQHNTLGYFSILAAQLGMLWCGVDVPSGPERTDLNRLGSQLGATAHCPDGTVHPVDLATARYLGTRVAHFAARLAQPTVPLSLETEYSV
ncbi:MAG: flavodoxin family protein [Burkholderiales bacterium]|nr:flavodoxin family protein [Burkholderiales bacterium]